MSQLMQAVVCHGPEDYQLEEIPIPEPGPGAALVRVEAVGICASDLKCYHGAAKFWGDKDRPAWAEREVVPGHEFVGTVVELEAQADLANGCYKRSLAVRGAARRSGSFSLY